MKNGIIRHYDMLIKEGNDPVCDPPELQEYMNKWDGQTFIDLLCLSRDKRVLEIGCGTGRIAVKVAPLVKTFCGIDFSPQTIITAKKHLPFANTELICADFLSYKFDEAYDVIYSSLTFMHIKNKKAAMKKAFGLLLPGGRFVLSIGKSIDTVLDYGTRKIRVYPDTPGYTDKMLIQSGFSDIRRYETESAYLFSALKAI
ncbi:MAG: class I SAM-dependent methyltransferase [Clostridiales bacterium]|nr:class I SAM-dependent methyltransferase [Clostridiales bacterium]